MKKRITTHTRVRNHKKPLAKSPTPATLVATGPAARPPSAPQNQQTSYQIEATVLGAAERKYIDARDAEGLALAAKIKADLAYKETGRARRQRGLELREAIAQYED